MRYGYNDGVAWSSVARGLRRGVVDGLWVIVIITVRCEKAVGHEVMMVWCERTVGHS